MHSSTATTPEGLADMVGRCKRQRRKPPAWEKCGRCGREWARDEFGEKMEHIGGHLEIDASGDKADCHLWVFSVVWVFPCLVRLCALFLYRT